MLLIPLLLLWARAPMRFAPRWKGWLITVVVALAMGAPWLGSGSGPVSATAADRYGAAAAGPDRRGPAGSAGDPEAVAPGLLREGTRVSATTGRFVLSGSRWNFVPDPPPARETRDGASPAGRSPGPAADRSAGGPSPAGDLEAVAESDEAGQPSPPGQPPARGLRRRTIVSENLMLQRVVEAIRADPEDDRWTVTGEISEFFGENRLRLQTVQRSSGR